MAIHVLHTGIIACYYCNIFNKIFILKIIFTKREEEVPGTRVRLEYRYARTLEAMGRRIGWVQIEACSQLLEYGGIPGTRVLVRSCYGTRVVHMYQ